MVLVHFNTKHCTRRQIRLPTLFHFRIDYEHTQFVSEQEGQENLRLHRARCKSLGRIPVWELKTFLLQEDSWL